jgi:nitroimidazol reductase NimA-like FMN-containing flavoprotein (pyridoxamine 5'-phosphate oxidase superfamily)
LKGLSWSNLAAAIVAVHVFLATEPDFLHRAPMAALVMANSAGQPFINSNLFVYDAANNCIYMHTAHVGRTKANILQNAQVCLGVSEMGRLLPASEALEFSVEYAGVVVFGRAEVLTEER